MFCISDVKELIWPLEDLMVQLKHIIAEAVEIWNGRLIGTKKRESSNRKDKQLQTQVLEDTDLSENEGPDIKNFEHSSEYSTNTDTSSSAILQSKKIKSLDHTDCKC